MAHIHPKPQTKLAHINLVSHHLLSHRQKALARSTSIGFKSQKKSRIGLGSVAHPHYSRSQRHSHSSNEDAGALSATPPFFLIFQ